MIEQTREIVRKFNSIYDEVLVEPDVLLPENEGIFADFLEQMVDRK